MRPNMKMPRFLGQVAALAIWLATPALALDDLSLNVAAGSEFVRPGDTVLVTLDVANLTAAINGAQVLIRYDDTILTLIDVISTDLGFTPPNQGWVEVVRLDDFGDVTYAAVINGGFTLDDHTIARFQFTVIAEGATSVVFRLDAPPFITKLTKASNNETIRPDTLGSGPIMSNCDDGLFCNGVETFDGVTCQPGTDPCDDGVACTVDTCDDVADTCTNTADDTLCDDGLFCTGVATCDPVFDCQAGTDPCDDGVGCTVDVCDDLGDFCTNIVNDANCDNGEFCDGAETCDAVFDCQPGTFPCDDGVGCTDDACDEVLDACTNIVNDANCDDLLFCTGVETCDAALDCQNGPVPNCDDGVGCTVDLCDETNDLCTNTPDDALCDNGLFCDGFESCDLVFDCQTDTDPCDDGVGCTVDVCDDLGDFCTNTPDDTLCDNGLFCDGAETCDFLLDCQLGTFPCDDGVGCTDDVCDDILDACTSTPNDANCDDGLFCTGVATCDAVADCQPGAFPCDDGVGCTDDACDDILDACTNLINDANCDNGDFCDGAETCDAVLDCLPGSDPCDDGVGCTVDTCDDIIDTCTNTVDDPLCDNGLFCDGAETCDPLLDCQASIDPCFPLSCDEATDTCFAPIHMTGLEVFYAGRFGVCVGGENDGLFCSGDAACLDGACDVSDPLADPRPKFLAAGSTATGDNITNYVRGITGIRVLFDNIVDFATTPDAAIAFEWSMPPECVGGGRDGLICNPDNPSDQCVLQGGTCEVPFLPVTDSATTISVTSTVQGGVTVVSIVLDDDHVQARWLKVTVDATQVTVSGVELDGELAGNPVVLPSGEGTPGGNAVFYIGNVPGDVDGDRKILLTDIGIIRAVVNPFPRVPITDLNDVDKDVKVLLTDVGDARAEVNPFFILPLITIP